MEGLLPEKKKGGKTRVSRSKTKKCKIEKGQGIDEIDNAEGSFPGKNRRQES